ncbi:MAG TPA: hypothetical protein VFQ68_08320 [Streptosporangiaceae bacterium]|nr:hypothetical protein [Streptosporangiaceae bacterium]
MTTGTAMTLTLPQPAETSLTAVLLLATAVWIGGLGQRRRIAAQIGDQVYRAATLVRIRGQPAGQVAHRLSRAERRDHVDLHPPLTRHRGGICRRDEHLACRSLRPQAVQVRRVAQVIEHHQPRPAGPAQPRQHAGRYRLGIAAIVQAQLCGDLPVSGQHRAPAVRGNPGQHLDRTRPPQRMGETRCERSLAAAVRAPAGDQRHDRRREQHVFKTRHRLRPGDEALSQRRDRTNADGPHHTLRLPSGRFGSPGAAIFGH